MYRDDFQNNAIEMTNVDEYEVNAYVAKVFGWMFLGLVVTALTTGIIVYGMSISYAFMDFVLASINMFFLIFIVQILLVGSISSRPLRMNPAVAKALFIVYAMSNGLTVGMLVVIFAWYIVGPATVAMAFGITAASFGAMALYGYVTKSDLTSMGSLLRMGLFGIIIASIANWFLGNSMLELAICVIGLFIFLGLVAYDTNKIKNQFAQVALQSYNPDGTVNEEMHRLASNLAIIGALGLYLNFINMLLFILRILGRRR